MIISQTHASTFKVKKTKGNSAIIESSIALEEGATYTIETTGLTEDPVYTKTHTPRKNSLTLGGNFSLLKGNNVQENIINFEARYGWSSITTDYGPLIFLEMNDSGAGYNTEFYIGGFYDYNFAPNRPQEYFVYGITGQILGGNVNYTSGANAQIYKLDAGGFLTWFLTRGTTALRTEALYEIKKINSSITSTEVTGFVGKLFLVMYF